MRLIKEISLLSFFSLFSGVVFCSEAVVKEVVSALNACTKGPTNTSATCSNSNDEKTMKLHLLDRKFYCGGKDGEHINAKAPRKVNHGDGKLAYEVVSSDQQPVGDLENYAYPEKMRPAGAKLIENISGDDFKMFYGPVPKDVYHKVLHWADPKWEDLICNPFEFEKFLKRISFSDMSHIKAFTQYNGYYDLTLKGLGKIYKQNVHKVGSADHPCKTIQPPQNPCGNTGVKGRGILGKWGPNQAADPIVTRCDPKTKVLQFVAIKRKDNGQWAIPGGMVDDGDNVSATLKKEFGEEALASTEKLKDESDEAFNARKAKIKEVTQKIFKKGDIVYKGYVDDPRNTDNSWMETTAMNFHLTSDVADSFKLHPGDDAGAVKWLTITNKDKEESEKDKLFASHFKMLSNLVLKLKSKHKVSLNRDGTYQCL